MKRFFAGLLCLLTMGACSLTLSGCTLKTGVDLMQLPKPNKDRQAITDELERVRSTDAVEDAPYEGENRNTVQIWMATRWKRWSPSSVHRPTETPTRPWC